MERTGEMIAYPTAWETVYGRCPDLSPFRQIGISPIFSTRLPLLKF